MELRHTDVVPVTGAEGARYNLLRLHFSDTAAPSLGTVYLCRRQVELRLSSATPKTFQKVAARLAVVALAGEGEEGHPPVLPVNEAQLAFLKASKVCPRLGAAPRAASGPRDRRPPTRHSLRPTLCLSTRLSLFSSFFAPTSLLLMLPRALPGGCAHGKRPKWSATVDVRARGRSAPGARRPCGHRGQRPRSRCAASWPCSERRCRCAPYEAASVPGCTDATHAADDLRGRVVGHCSLCPHSGPARITAVGRGATGV